jgi:hypothetical protein
MDATASTQTVDVELAQPMRIERKKLRTSLR